MADDEEFSTTADAERVAGEMSEDEIDQNLEDTFPASDPPSWTLGTNHVEDSRVESDNESSDASNKRAAENPTTLAATKRDDPLNDTK